MKALPQMTQKRDPATVFERYRRQLLAFISRRVGPETDSEDILQEVFLRFVQTDAVNPISQVAAWLFRVARNRIVDTGRKQREQSLPAVRDDDDALLYEVTDFLIDDNRSPDMELIRTTIWEEMTAVLDELPTEQRDAFLLTEVEGFSFRELSEDTGIPVATLLSRKHYAVKHLRRRLADLYVALLED